MKTNICVLGVLLGGLVVLQACNHPRTEGEQPRTPVEREVSPHEGPASTTDTLHNDSIREVDSTRFPDDPATPNF